MKKRWSTRFEADEIFGINAAEFEAKALETYRFQFEENSFYREYCTYRKAGLSTVSKIADIPFLPISFFKTKKISTTNFEPEAIFESSGTTGSENSKHYIKNLNLYEQSFNKAFEAVYGDAGNYCILALLPSYLERNGSSLVYMVSKWIEKSKNQDSGFYLYDTEKLFLQLQKNEQQGIQTLLIGVSYALYDFAAAYPQPLKHCIVMETGGMKGRSLELTKEELHGFLQQQWELQEIHAEYGMTELLSQAYSKGKGIYQAPPWMQVCIRAEDDPYQLLAYYGSSNETTAGALNIIDLANRYSCSFIATDDTGIWYPDRRFKLLGRLENSDIRGCGLMLIS
jgi:hypothetical protein